MNLFINALSTMIQSIKKAFAKPTAREYAQRMLEAHQRELIEARRISQASQSNVQYHERVIADLKRTLETE